MSTRFVFIMNYSSKFQDNWLKIPQNIVTETLTVPLPTETPHKSVLEKPVTSGQCVMSAYVSNEDVMRAEILLTINCSSQNIGKRKKSNIFSVLNIFKLLLVL